MSDQAALIARLLAQREQWVELAAGKRVCVRRPAETEIATLRSGISVERAAACVVDWAGFSEADILGPAVGSSSPLLFDAALWLEVLRDNAEWLSKVVDTIVSAVRSHLDAREAARKN